MSDKAKIWATVVLMFFAATSAAAKQLKLNESPAQPGEWGYQPGDGYSLVIDDETAHPATWDDAESWRASTSINGSPGLPD